jgi:ABC-2 type transport system permease protein
MTSQTSRLDAREGTRVYDSATRPHHAIEELIELFRYRDLLAQWTVRNVTLRYKRSVLGVVWTLLEPLTMMIILSVVFSTVFRFPQKNYAIYVLGGLVFFDFFSRCTLQMAEEVATSQSLFHRIYLPRSVFAVATMLSYLTHWFIALLPLTAIMLILGQPLTRAMLAVPLGMIFGALFALGCGLIVATVGSFFPDVKLVYQVLITAWFYATPIIYPLEIVPERLQPVFEFNPLYHLLRLVRDPFYGGGLPSAEGWLIVGCLAVATAVAGWWIFCHWKDAIDYTS